MRLREATIIAERFAEMMSPFCARIEVAGSVRRSCPEVKDVELVAVPRWDEHPGAAPSLFAAEAKRVNLLHEWAMNEAAGAGVRWIKTGTPEVVDWTPKPEGNYWRALVEDRVKLDLFLAAPENYGMILAIRTGCAEFSQALMTCAKHRTPYHVEGGYLRDRDGAVLETPEERDVFKALKLEFRRAAGTDGAAHGARSGEAAVPAERGSGRTLMRGNSHSFGGGGLLMKISLLISNPRDV